MLGLRVWAGQHGARAQATATGAVGRGSGCPEPGPGGRLCWRPGNFTLTPHFPEPGDRSRARTRAGEAQVPQEPHPPPCTAGPPRCSRQKPVSWRGLARAPGRGRWVPELGWQSEVPAVGPAVQGHPPVLQVVEPVVRVLQGKVHSPLRKQSRRPVSTHSCPQTTAARDQSPVWESDPRCPLCDGMNPAETAILGLEQPPGGPQLAAGPEGQQRPWYSWQTPSGSSPVPGRFHECSPSGKGVAGQIRWRPSSLKC